MPDIFYTLGFPQLFQVIFQKSELHGYKSAFHCSQQSSCLLLPVTLLRRETSDIMKIATCTYSSKYELWRTERSCCLLKLHGIWHHIHNILFDEWEGNMTGSPMIAWVCSRIFMSCRWVKIQHTCAISNHNALSTIILIDLYTTLILVVSGKYKTTAYVRFKGRCCMHIEGGSEPFIFEVDKPGNPCW